MCVTRVYVPVQLNVTPSRIMTPPRCLSTGCIKISIARAGIRVVLARDFYVLRQLAISRHSFLIMRWLCLNMGKMVTAHCVLTPSKMS